MILFQKVVIYKVFTAIISDSTKQDILLNRRVFFKNEVTKQKSEQLVY